MEKALLIGIYFDLENMASFDVSRLLRDITLKIEENVTSIFAIKLACGDTNSIDKFRKQLTNQNFNIRETPHISEKNLKNRADLILSLEAFESLYQNQPEIDLYVFITSDTDFTVVMDKLRKYGKTVWLVTKKEYKVKTIFTSSSDKILIIDDYTQKNEKATNSKISGIEEILKELEFNEIEGSTMKEVLDSFEKDIWHVSGQFTTKIKNTIKDFSYKGRKINSQSKLFDELKLKKYLDIKKEGNTNYFKIL